LNKKVVVCYKLTDLIEIYDLAGAIFGTTIEAYGRPIITENKIYAITDIPEFRIVIFQL
jgi:hypothetical protein